MGLFPSANDFRKAGPGVEKDTPRKTGIGRFFELVGRDMSGMFLANLLTCIGFLPVICLVYVGFLMNNLTVMVVSAIAGGILAGPALTGMYDTVLRALRDEAGYCGPPTAARSSGTSKPPSCPASSTAPSSPSRSSSSISASTCCTTAPTSACPCGWPRC